MLSQVSSVWGGAEGQTLRRAAKQLGNLLGLGMGWGAGGAGLDPPHLSMRIPPPHTSRIKDHELEGPLVSFVTHVWFLHLILTRVRTWESRLLYQIEISSPRALYPLEEEDQWFQSKSFIESVCQEQSPALPTLLSHHPVCFLVVRWFWPQGLGPGHLVLLLLPVQLPDYP